MADTATLQPCRVLRGFFVLRPCGTETRDVCPVCHKPMCIEHQRTVAGRLLCIECAVREHDPIDRTHRDTDDRVGFDTYYYSYGTTFGSSSSPGSDPGFSGGGGAFGGGGAGGSWDDAAGVYAYRDTFYSGEGQNLAAFGAADFAAFDQAGAGGAFDETDDGGFFDS